MSVKISPRLTPTRPGTPRHRSYRPGYLRASQRGGLPHAVRYEAIPQEERRMLHPKVSLTRTPDPSASETLIEE